MKLWLLLWIIICIGVPASLSLPPTDTNNPKAKFFSFFSRIRVKNDVCIGDNGRAGVCLLQSECKGVRGFDHGECPLQNGVCCEVERSCRSVSREKVSYFVNGNYPAMDNGQILCDFLIDVTNPDVCQVRLDFDEFELAQPRQDDPDSGDPYECLDDSLRISPPPINGLGFQALCGDMKGQHIYIPVDSSTNGGASITLFVSTGERSSLSELPPFKWKIRVTQIDCKEDRNNQAPVGCLQYLTGREGVLQSFNYNEGSGPYLSNLRYAICLKRFPDTCRIEFKAHNFSLETTFKDTEVISVEPVLAEVIGTGSGSCDVPGVSQDFLFLPEGNFNATSHTESKFCGSSFGNHNNIVSSDVKGPITLNFRSDGTAQDGTIKDVVERGFSIEYKQIASCLRK